MKSLHFCLLFLVGCFCPARAEMFSQLGGAAPDLVNLQSQIFPYPNSPSGSPAIVDTRLRASIPVARMENDNWSITLNTGDVHVSDPIQLSPSGSEVPQDLWTVEANVNYNHRYEGGQTLGLTLGVGSDGDQPFLSFSETEIQALVKVTLPSWGQNEWLFGVSFSNNRPYLDYIPIPLIGYTFRYDPEGINASIGIPFALFRWRFAARWDVFLSAIFPTNVVAELNWHPTNWVRLFWGFLLDPASMGACRPCHSTNSFFSRLKKGGARLGLAAFRTVHFRNKRGL